MQKILNEINHKRKIKAIRKAFPNYALIDQNLIKFIEVDYGKFYFSEPLQSYPNIFQEIEDYQFNDITNDDVVLDLGAFVGVSSIKLAQYAKLVYSFEPLFIDELIDNLNLNKILNVYPFPFALGSDDIYEFCWKSQFCKGIEFKDILKKCDETPTFLKMDVEGAEWHLSPDDLAGFRAIEAEIHSKHGENPKHFINNLERLGFSVTYWETENKQVMVSGRKK
jgi:hypothetical protein